MEVLGGRMHNVVSIKIGGVRRVPEKSEVEKVNKRSGHSNEVVHRVCKLCVKP